MTRKYIAVTLIVCFVALCGLAFAGAPLYEQSKKRDGSTYAWDTLANEWRGLLGFADGSLAVIAKPYGVGIAERDVPNHTAGFLPGYNPDVDSASETLWQVGGLYPWATQATKLQAFSTSSSDAAAGAGIRAVHIEGLTSAFAIATETLTLNGITRVESVNTYYRVNYFHAATAGASLSAVGDIDLVRTGGSAVYARIRAGYTNSAKCAFTIPAGNTGYFTGWTVSCGATQAGHYVEARVRATCDQDGDLTPGIFQLKDNAIVQDGTSAVRQFFSPLRIPAGADVQITVLSDSGTSNAIVTGSMEGWFESD